MAGNSTQEICYGIWKDVGSADHLHKLRTDSFQGVWAPCLCLATHLEKCSPNKSQNSSQCYFGFAFYKWRPMGW